MIINPNLSETRSILRTIPGTRMLRDGALIGTRFGDPFHQGRIWTIQGLYAPIPGRMLGGIRAKLVDQKNFTTFCNQRDLEVLLKVARPGTYCEWLGADYVEPGERGWCGLCVDEEDLSDDLYDRELTLRACTPPGSELLPCELIRRIHDGLGNDFEELLTLLWDRCPRTGRGPDPRRETVTLRWQSIERTPKSRRRNLWQLTAATRPTTKASRHEPSSSVLDARMRCT